MESDDERLSVAQIVDDDYPAIGGYQNVLRSLAATFVDEDLADVDVVCRTDTGRERPSDVDVYPVLEASSIPKVGVFLTIFRNWLTVFQYVRRVKPDVIHAHQVYPSATYTIPAALTGTPVVCTSHGTDIQKNESVGYGVRRNAVLDLLTRLTLRFCTVHTTVSESMIPDAVDAGSSRSKVRAVPNGIDPDKPAQEYTEPENGSRIHDALTDADFTALFLGRLMEKKRPADVIRAVASLVEDGRSVSLLVAGKGDEERLRQLTTDLGIEENVRFLGFVSDTEKWQLMCDSDVYVLPSVTEGFPITYLEAGAAGTPIVATETEPFTDLIDDGEDGLLVAPRDPDALAGVLDMLYEDHELRSDLGNSIEERIADQYDVSRVASEYVSLYRDVLAVSRQR